MKLNKNAFKDLVYISQAVGNSVDYTQGGGGNTSVKLDDELMAVKASGFKLKQITESDGYVVVNYKNIKEYHEKVNINENRDFDKESSEFVRKNIVEMEGLKKLRPSVEAGFHSLLKKYVIHTHSVYANMICCTKNSRELVDKIFNDKPFKVAWIPYINPGFNLTLEINKVVQEGLKATGDIPDVIFMENHGLIVTSDDKEDCVSLHSQLNEAIREYLKLNVEFPSIELVEEDENKYVSRTQYLINYIKENNVTEDFMNNVILYPDQLVYLNGNITGADGEKKLEINGKTGEVVYNTNHSEALTIEETLLAYVFVIDCILRSGLELKTMSHTGIDFINNWESEAYRKSIASRSVNKEDVKGSF